MGKTLVEETCLEKGFDQATKEMQKNYKITNEYEIIFTFQSYQWALFIDKGLKDGIVGLQNNSLFCYMNACLQGLLVIDEMRDYYLEKKFSKYKNI